MKPIPVSVFPSNILSFALQPQFRVVDWSIHVECNVLKEMSSRAQTQISLLTQKSSTPPTSYNGAYIAMQCPEVQSLTSLLSTSIALQFQPYAMEYTPRLIAVKSHSATYYLVLQPQPSIMEHTLRRNVLKYHSTNHFLPGPAPPVSSSGALRCDVLKCRQEFNDHANPGHGAYIAMRRPSQMSQRTE